MDVNMVVSSVNNVINDDVNNENVLIQNGGATDKEPAISLKKVVELTIEVHIDTAKAIPQ